ncbi:unnamed protein product [Ambrosiozyma monospora]|uniref:Unnamed protein product n=1 Tax=Ambrosiozyma monospora TaxID=43982 RepID=A0ACB5T7P9_AMBMO|nr:unnamed protein product [Ambrosiozyma monospora]
MTGLLENGTSSDVQVKAFDTTYQLHTLLLKRSPYFKCLIEWNQKKDTRDKDGDVNTLVNESLTLNMETDDPLITKDSFELTLKRLYAIEDCEKERKIPAQMIVTAFFFQMDDIKEDMTKHWNENELSINFVITAFQMVSDHDYGEYGTSLRDRCKEYLYDNGWQAGHEAWIGIQPSLISEINSKADDDEIELAVTKFRQTFNFFTLTYGQQCEILKQRLPNDKLIFDMTSLTNATLLTTHVQYSSMHTNHDKISPIPPIPSEMPHSEEFKQYPHNRHLKGSSEVVDDSTIVPPFRFSIVLKPDSFFLYLFDTGLYHRGFSYCGSKWRVSLGGDPSDHTLYFSVERLKESYKEPLSVSCDKSSSIEIPFFNQSLKECEASRFPLSNEIFRIAANFHDWRHNAPIYYQVFFEYDNGEKKRGVSGCLFPDTEFDHLPKSRWSRINVPDRLWNKTSDEPIKMSFLFGTI